MENPIRKRRRCLRLTLHAHFGPDDGRSPEVLPRAQLTLRPPSGREIPTTQPKLLLLNAIYDHPPIGYSISRRSTRPEPVSARTA